MALTGEWPLAVAMIAAFVLAIAGTRLAVRPAPDSSDRRRGVLMIVVAVVLVANVLILTV